MTAGPQHPGTGEFEITVPRGPLVCGYCGETEWFSNEAQKHLNIGHLELTGYHALGVGPAGELVVLAEATWLGGRRDHLPHLCEAIPPAMYEKYAAEIAELTRSTP